MILRKENKSLITQQYQNYRHEDLPSKHAIFENTFDMISNHSFFGWKTKEYRSILTIWWLSYRWWWELLSVGTKYTMDRWFMLFGHMFQHKTLTWYDIDVYTALYLDIKWRSSIFYLEWMNRIQYYAMLSLSEYLIHCVAMEENKTPLIFNSVLK